MNSAVVLPRDVITGVNKNKSALPAGPFHYEDVVLPIAQNPPVNVDSDCPYSMLKAIPMKKEGSKQPYQDQISLFLAFCRTGITFISFQSKQERDRKKKQEGQWDKCKKETRGYGKPFIRRLLKKIGVSFLSYEDQLVANATRLDVFQNRVPLKVIYDDGLIIDGRLNSCMSLEKIKERIILLKAPLGSGKSYQARRLEYARICQLTTTRALALETSRVTGFSNYQDVSYNRPLSQENKIVVLAPSLYRLKFEFKPFDCLIIDEAESFFADIFSGLCRGSKLELGMDVFELLMQTSGKIIIMDGFLKNSSLSVATNYASSLEEIMLVIANYTVERGTL